jgi:hypothetical protein
MLMHPVTCKGVELPDSNNGRVSVGASETPKTTTVQRVSEHDMPEILQEGQPHMPRKGRLALRQQFVFPQWVCG